MWVGELSVHDELELVMQGKISVSHLDVLVLTLLDNSSSINGLQDSINAVLQVLKENGLSRLNSELNSLDHSLVAQTSDLEIIFLFFFSDPGNTLELRIDDKRISLRVSKNSTVLS